MQAGGMMQVDLDHFYAFGDVYEAVEACDHLETMLARLHRQRLLTDEQWEQSKASIAGIRTRVEAYAESRALTPAGPKLA
jgi:hypothetical protein